jgi:hypothetical protein
MSSTPPPTDDNFAADATGQTKSLRLGNAEQIAFDRLDGAAEGSLKEALATAPGEASDGDAQASFAFLDAEAGTAPSDWSQPKPQPAPRVGLDAPAPDIAAVQPSPPLAEALGAAVQLAADASAAAHALESLKQLLERQLPAHDLATLHAQSAQHRPEPARLPPPLPPQAAMDTFAPAAAIASDSPRLPPPPLTRPAAREQRRFDVRGFFAGFTLSWAIGVVLYLFITAG